MKKYIFPLLAAMALSACSDETTAPTAPTAKLQVELAPISRAIIEGTTLPKDSYYGILCYNETGTITDSAAVHYYNGISTLVNEIMLNEQPRWVYAVYPLDYVSPAHNFTVSSFFFMGLENCYPLSVVTTTSDRNNQTDFLWGFCDEPVSAQYPKAFIPMRHALARATVKVTCDESFERDGHNLLLFSKMYNVPTSGYMLPAERGYIEIDKYTEASCAVSDYIKREVSASAAVSPVTSDILVIPGTYADVRLALAFDGADEISFPLPEVDWGAGMQYTYNVVLHAKNGNVYASLDGITVKEWEWVGESMVGQLEPGTPLHPGSDITPEAPEGVVDVDLGLPSGTRWANMNIGAITPDGIGNYYAWGEVEPKETYTYDNSLAYNLTREELTQLGFINEEGVLTPAHDAATANWGSDWRMPTSAEIDELIEYCTFEAVSYEGTPCVRVTGLKGHSIYLALGGCMLDDALGYGNNRGLYWSSTLSTERSAGQYMFINTIDTPPIVNNNYQYVRIGCPVRAVYAN